MSFDLYAWKMPVPRSAAQADQMLQRFYEEDRHVFAADPSLRRFRKELLESYPALESFSVEELMAGNGLTWTSTPPDSDPCIEMNFSWSGSDRTIDDNIRLSHAH